MPKLLIQPPSHPQHELSLCLSLLSLRKCLKISNLGVLDECRCHTGIAEIGLIALRGGYAEQEDSTWADGLLSDIEKAISQGLVLAQRHPSLYLYTPHLTFLSSQLAEQQGNMKFARAALSRLLNSTTYPRFPAHVVYAAHLDNITFLISNPTPTNAAMSRPSTPTGSPTKSPSKLRPVSPTKPRMDAKAQQDTNRRQILHILGSLRSLASANAHTSVVTLCEVIKLRLLVRWGLWGEVSNMLKVVEESLDIGIPAATGPTENKENGPEAQSLTQAGTTAPLQKSALQPGAESTQSEKAADPKASGSAAVDAVEVPTVDVPYHLAMLQAHALILAIMFHVYSGSVPKDHITPRLARLHTLLDSGLFDTTDERSSGLVELPLSDDTNTRPLTLQLTPPSVITSMTYLISAVSRRDPVGRNPKRGVFAREGLVHLEGEMSVGAVAQTIPIFASRAEMREAEARMFKIQADLMMEGIGLDISRSSFVPAKRDMDALITHLRAHDIWECYAARITLLQGYLAHAEAGWKYTLMHTNTDAPISKDRKGKKKQVAFAGEDGNDLTEARRQWGRAKDCYRVAAAVAQESGDNWLCVAAKAAGLALDLGLRALGEHAEQWRIGEGEEQEAEGDNNIDEFEWMAEAAELVKECHGMGGTLGAVGRVLQASLDVQDGTATLSAKTALKTALTLTTNSQENYLRALVLAMCSSHYLLTAEDHARDMLEACSNIACGLGVGQKKSTQSQSQLSQDASATEGGNKLGNVPLRLWCGERLAEVHARNGEEVQTRKLRGMGEAVALAAKAKMKGQCPS